MTIVMRGLLLALCFAGCSYRAGSFQFVDKPNPGGRLTAGCLDIGVGAHAASRDDAPVVMYAFGNRCDMPATVDLRAARAWGVVASGERVALVAYDPREELGLQPIAAAWAGSAAIEYMTAERGVRPVFVEVCVELGGVVPELGTHVRCFDPRRGGTPTTDERCGANVVVGRCGRFAAGWQPAMLRLEMGYVEHRTSIAPMIGRDEEDAITGRLVDGSKLAGRGLNWRFTGGMDGLYLAMDVGMSRVEGPPVYPVATTNSGVIARGPTDNSSSGWIVPMRMGVGKELRLGRVMLGGEAGLGIQVTSLHDSSGAYVVDPKAIVDVRGHAGIWLTRHVSVSGFASTNLLDRDDRTFGVAVGIATLPWDGLVSRW